MLAVATLALAALAATGEGNGPIRPHRENPRYLEFRGEPTVLVTSGEHYGAVLNLDFDFVPYLNELARRGFNQTRTFSGTYREVPGSFNIGSNTLAPKTGRYLSPWVKVGDDPEKFDLDKFEPAYFERLKTFLREADRRGIVVELVLFCPLYEQKLWDASPMNARNNVNGVGDCPREQALTLDHPKLVEKQLAFVRKVVQELNGLDNLYYEVCNEPYFGGVTIAWQNKVIEAITGAEEGLPKKHMIAQNIANEKARIVEPNSAVGLFNFHYARPPVTIAMNADLNKAIGDDETGFQGTGDAVYRKEAWDFLIAGGAAFSHLDYSFTIDHEDGTAKVESPTPGGGGPTFRGQIAGLKRFVEEFDFIKMSPDDSVIRGGVPDGVTARALVEPGRQYAVYFNGAMPEGVKLSIDLPAGEYRASWFDPVGARQLQDKVVTSEGGPTTIEGPACAEDLALSLVVRGAGKADASTKSNRGLKVSDNGRYLVKADGSPFFWLGDTAWELFHRLDRDETTRPRATPHPSRHARIHAATSVWSRNYARPARVPCSRREGWAAGGAPRTASG